MNKLLERRPMEYTLSIVIRNFILKASIINPKTTFTEFSQPPDFGILLITEGNKANIVNGFGIFTAINSVSAYLYVGKP